MRNIELHDARVQQLSLEADGTGVLTLQLAGVIVVGDPELEDRAYAARASFRIRGLSKFEGRLRSLAGYFVIDGFFIALTGDRIELPSLTDLEQTTYAGIDLDFANEEVLKIQCESFRMESFAVGESTGRLPPSYRPLSST